MSDLDRGGPDRFLVSPVRRTSLLAGPLMQLGIVIAIQSLIIIALVRCRSHLRGRGSGGRSVDRYLDPRARRWGRSRTVSRCWRAGGNVLIAAANFIVMPLTFMSRPFGTEPDARVDAEIARFNPVNWAVEAGARR